MLHNNRILCFGNITTDTDQKTTIIANKNGMINRGLITSVECDIGLDGYYHTTLGDIHINDIFTLIRKFNKVIIFAQSRDSYNNDDLYNVTVNLLKLAIQNNSQIPVEIINIKDIN